VSPARRSSPAVPPGLLAAACAAALAGCPGPRSASGPPDAAEAGAGTGADAGAAAAAGTATAAVDGVPPPLKLEVRYQMPDAGLALIDFAPGGARPSIEPTSRLELSTNIGLQNYRVRLFDEIDRAMTSDDQVEEPGDAIRYRIQLSAPLRAGHRYALVVDAQTGSAVADSTGRLYPDQRLEFTVAGAREPDAPPAGTRTKKPRPPGKPSRQKSTRR
jgi:hypothetical protein